MSDITSDIMAEGRGDRIGNQRVGAGSGNGHRGDGAEQIAKAAKKLGHTVTTAQVRILRALQQAGRPLTRKELKDATGHWPHRSGFHRDWVNALRGLHPYYVLIQDHEPGYDVEKGGYGTPHHIHQLTARGASLLRKSERTVSEEQERRELMEQETSHGSEQGQEVGEEG